MKKNIFLTAFALALAFTVPITVLADSITWATPVIVIDSDMLVDIETLLLADPPEDASGLVYVVTDAASDDGDWMISITNLVGVSAPYTEWNWESNAYWAGSVECSGTDPDWVCDYYEPPAVGGTDTSILFPWRPGTRAIYGVLGVHDGTLADPDDRAVDFVGGDNLGTSIMPPNVYAAETGTVVSVCRDANNIGVKIQGNHLLGYYHLTTATDISIGDTFTAGQQIGILRYGSWDNVGCGYASQGNSTYHLHFVFTPTDGYFQIGGCNLNVTSKMWVCGSKTVGIQGLLTNGGDAGVGTTPGDTGTPTTASMGGEHIWDGIVLMLVRLTSGSANRYLPEQDTRISFFLDQAKLVMMIIFDVLDIYVFGPQSLTTAGLLVAIGLMMAGELTIFVLDKLFVFAKFALDLLKFIAL